MKRGDVVIVDWPLSRPAGTRTVKPRPAVVVQNDKDNARLTNTIVAMVTSMVARSFEPTQVFVDIGTTDGTATGLRQNSVVNCINLLTLEQTRILHVIGSLSPNLMQQLNTALKLALDLP